VAQRGGSGCSIEQHQLAGQVFDTDDRIELRPLGGYPPCQPVDAERINLLVRPDSGQRRHSKLWYWWHHRPIVPDLAELRQKNHPSRGGRSRWTGR
jgi:hypothetical protein